MADIQWFPGHMARAKRILQEDLKLVDAVIEVVDARIPSSSRNPMLGKMLGAKPLILVLNKSDLADPGITARWERHFRERGIETISVDSVKGSGVAGVPSMVKKAAGKKAVIPGTGGRLSRPPRCMVAGIPNVGKSLFINRLVGRRAAKTENRPGVTRGRQWIRVAEIDLLDTPGILWPKFDDPEVGYRLAVTGAIRDQVFDVEEVAGRLSVWLAENFPGSFAERYRIEVRGRPDPWELLAQIGKARGLVQHGGKVDTGKASILLLKEFRAGLLGRFTLDAPEEAGRT
ncbi:MAG: ribosome biogenesis GTPase YlqF [Bacillota bacterium]